MPDEKKQNAVRDLAYLAACAVNGRRPDPERVAGMDLQALYHMAELHMMCGITAMALESAGVRDEAFTQAKGKAVRKVSAFEIERAAVLASFEEEGIWYMALKGAVLQSYYPRIGMREMSDNDILYDASRRADVRGIMEGLGFKTDLYVMDEFSHDIYNKPPVCSFEMHPSLFTPLTGDTAYNYYLDVRSRLLKDDGNGYGYHFSREDCYVYLIAHEYKHFSTAGIGLRPLLDTYVYLKKEGGRLDRDYIAGELDKLGLREFEEKNRLLAEHLFDGAELSGEEQRTLDYMAASGVFGSRSIRVGNTVGKLGDGAFAKLRYLLRRIILPMEVVRASYPTFLRYPILLPFLPLYRAVRGLLLNRKSLRSEFRALAEYGDRPQKQ